MIYFTSPIAFSQIICYNIRDCINLERGGILDGCLRRMMALLTAAMMAAVMLFGASEDATLLHADAAAEILGVDVSKYQEEIDWKTLAQSDVKFAILRCCKVIRAYDDWEADPTFERNYAEAKAAGLAVGCYMYTDAATIEEFEEDCAYMLGFLKDKSFEFPVFLDLESASRQEHLSPEVFMPALLTGLEMIEDAGHTAGVYSSTAFFSECIDRQELQADGYPIWEANYFNTVNGLASPAGHDLSADAAIWQYSGCGRMPGIRTTVDCNICYTYSFFNHAATIVNSILPSGTLKNGSNFTVAGTVQSQSVLRTITGSIYDVKVPDKPVQTVTVYPHAREYKLTGFFTKKLVFSTLPDGEYELHITAVDASDTTIEVAKSQFTISPDPDSAAVMTPEEPESEQEEQPEQTQTDHPEKEQREQEEYLQYSGDYNAGAEFRARVSCWLFKNVSMRKICRKASEIGLKLQLERTPLYRIVNKTFWLFEIGYLTSAIRLEIAQERAALLEE